jgi:signal transduction histidine kinase
LATDWKNNPQSLDFPTPKGLEERFTEAEDAILDMINQKVAGGRSLQEIVGFVFESTSPIMPCDRVGLAFLEEGGKRVVAHIALAKYEPMFLRNGYAADLKGSSLERVLRLGEPRVIGDLELYVRAHPRSDSTRLLLKEGVRSSMTCPIVVEGRPLGFLFRSSRFPNAYSEREMRLHAAVAERLGQAVEKAWRIEQLEASNRAYMEMLGFVSHEIKNPLSSIISEARILHQGYLGDLAPKQSEMVGKMLRKSEYLLNLTREYLDLARMEEGRMELNTREGVDFLVDVVAPSLELVQAQVEDRKQVLGIKAPAGLVVECDADLLKIVVTNLVGNASKYGIGGGALDLSAQSDGRRLTVSVWNEGPGFPESEKSKLFRRFSRLRTPELLERKGSGVGLYTCWHIIQLHGGKIWAESELGKWAKFSFEIPLVFSAQKAAEKTT